MQLHAWADCPGMDFRKPATAFAILLVLLKSAGHAVPPAQRQEHSVESIIQQ
jgi:hypothetical protein